MANIAVIFPGQGTQSPGMGRALYESSAAARGVFEKADKIRPGTSEQCFQGTPEELMLTVNTQPCLWAAEMAVAEALKEAGVSDIKATAGFSLGEITALTLAGAVDFRTGFTMVCKRAELMDEAANESDAAMAAVMKLSQEELIRVCNKFNHIWPVNYNCPGQITVAGLQEEMEDFLAAVKEAGGLAKLLKVSGAFHSPLMKGAAEKFGEELAEVEFSDTEFPLYSNYTSLPYEGDAATLLKKQIYNPVKWQAIIENMVKAGIDTFIEAGPGKTLSGFVKRIAPQARILAVADTDSLKKALEVLESC